MLDPEAPIPCWLLKCSCFIPAQKFVSKSLTGAWEQDAGCCRLSSGDPVLNPGPEALCGPENTRGVPGAWGMPISPAGLGL